MNSNGANSEAWRSPPQTKFLLLALGVIYFFSVADRGIISILAQPIKTDLGLSDLELGVVGGIAFAGTFAIASLPAARFSERHGRVGILSAALAIWSIATALCGAAGNMFQLVLARAGVGAGESVCHPCAQSLIADSYPPHRRASAVAVYSLAVPIATLFGILGGAFMAGALGWRMTFVVMGLVGLPIALLARVTLKEPERGKFDAIAGDHVPSFAEALRHLRGRRSFVHAVIGMTATMIAATGMGAFLSAFLLRGPFGLDIRDVGLLYGAIAGGGMFVGMLAGGVLSDRLGRRDVRYYALVPAISLVVIAAALALALMQRSLFAFTVFAVVGHVGLLVYIGPTWAIVHGVTPPRMRATAAAILALVTGIIGSGLGPVLTGWVSDIAAARAFSGDYGVCTDGMVSNAACAAASFQGVRDAMIVLTILHLYAAVHYWRASQSLLRDFIQQQPAARMENTTMLGRTT